MIFGKNLKAEVLTREEVIKRVKEKFNVDDNDIGIMKTSFWNSEDGCFLYRVILLNNQFYLGNVYVRN